MDGDCLCCHVGEWMEERGGVAFAAWANFSIEKSETKERGWCKTSFDSPPELFIGGKKVINFFELVERMKNDEKLEAVKENKLQNLTSTSIFEKTIQRINQNKNNYKYNIKGEFEVIND
ncbi:hypothetical protein ACTFIW_000843 [Dictyostelium discoideum]